MKKSKLSFLLIFNILIILDFFSMYCYAQNYVSVIESESNIYFETSVNSELVTSALEGDIFEVTSKVENWVGILLFSGEYRYISSTSVEELEELPNYPESNSVKEEICIEVVDVEDKSMKESINRFPNDIYEQIDFERILTDRYKLEIFRKYRLPAPYYTRLLDECVENQWY